MCGIVGYVGTQNALPILLDGLQRLEYRGYDSAGLAYAEGETLKIVRVVGKVSQLVLKVQPAPATTGIAHTRWATHGEPSERNAHPHHDCSGTISVAHNGIIENYAALRKQLEEAGHTFTSDTDTEVIAHLIEDFSQGASIEEGVRKALAKLVGTYGLAVIAARQPETIFVARKGSPLVIGIGKNETIIASDASAIVSRTKNVIYLEDDEMAVISRQGVRTTTTTENIALDKKIHLLEFDAEEAEKGTYGHYMLKEMFEQPETIKNALRGRLLDDTAKFGGIDINALRKASRFIITACGTSLHAAMVGKYMLEQYARVPVEVEHAAELRYRKAIIGPTDVIWAISQSGETADTLAAMRKAKEHGATVYSIVNVVGSTIARESAGGIYMHAGPEIGVASTKAFTSQIATLALITLLIGRERGTITAAEGKKIADELRAIPEKIALALEENPTIAAAAKDIASANNAFFIGRGYQYPVALEGALKLKEISYIHAEGYAAAEMKHGPIALIDSSFPVIAINPHDDMYDKMMSNIQEVRARKGKVITIVSHDDPKMHELSSHVIKVPQTIDMLAPLLTIIPLQLLAYHTALLRGCAIDQPRNLAKSVTVE